LLGQKVMIEIIWQQKCRHMCQGENLLGSSHLEDSANELHYDKPEGKKG
jgi:hypothetical protein